jgi:beta-xylosidase
MAVNWPPNLFLLLTALASFLVAVTVGSIWLGRARRLRAWTNAAKEKWEQFDSQARAHRTTAEVTLLSVDSLEPTGSWITIRWNRFNHVQRAWIATLYEPIWPGSVLLISPDPAQVRPGVPWPATYYIQASDCLAWAPGEAAPSKASHKTHGRPIRLSREDFPR